MIDLEAIVETDDGSRFDKVTALIIGTVAVLAAILGAIQIDLSQKDSRAAAQGSRSAVQIFAGTNASGDRLNFTVRSQQEAIGISLAALTRTLAVLEQGGQSADVEDARMRADLAAAERLQAIADEMGRPPPADLSLDPLARRLTTVEAIELWALSVRQNVEVDSSQEFGARGGRAVVGLSMVALAGVLVGLAAVLGEGSAGRFALGAAALAVGAAAVAAVSAVM